MNSMKPKVCIALNSTWNLVNFRSGLITALIDSGYEVVALAPADDYVDRLVALGARFVPLSMDNQGTNPLNDALLFWRFWRILRFEKPVAFLGFTVKPNVYGSLAAHTLGVPVVNNIAGLGAVFVEQSYLTRLLKGLYKIALSRSSLIFFQNNDDRRMFIHDGLVKSEVTDLLPGSGVDLDRFKVQGSSFKEQGDGKFRFLLIARMLWDKGVGEYIEASRRIRQRHPNIEFILLGFLDVQNPAAITRKQMEEWVAEGVVSYLGETDDVRPFIVDADCVVLPSYYREGTPRSLLETAAMGRPIITTDAVGCREVVDDGVNGYLCKARDIVDLVSKMEKMILLSPRERFEMGQRGRKKAEREFDEQIVIKKYLNKVQEILSDQL